MGSVGYEYACPKCQGQFMDFVDWQGSVPFVKCPQCKQYSATEAYGITEKAGESLPEGETAYGGEQAAARNG